MKEKLSGLIGIVLMTLVLSSQIAPFEVKANTEIEYTMATDSDFSDTRDGSFRYIGNDEYVEIPHVIKGVNVTSYSRMFYEKSVKGVKSTNKNVTSMSSMFSMFRNSQATELDLSNLDTSSVTNMAGMFNGNQATEIDLSGFDTSNVTNMNQMFENSQAKELDLSSFDTSNVTNMRQMFRDSRATELDVSSFDTSNVINMYRVFNNSQARSLDLSGFDTSNVTDMSQMFRDSRVAELDLSSFDMSNVTNTSDMFSGANATIGYAKTKQEVDILNATTNKPARLLFVVKPITQSNTEIEYVMATDSDFSGTSNGSFKYIGSDEYVDIPHVIKGVNVTSYWSMFDRTSVKGVKSTNTNVTNMSSMFRDSKATELDVSNLDTSSVTYMSSMFSGSRARELDVSSFDTSNVTHMDEMFQYSHATELDLSGLDTSKVTDMGYMFCGSQATNLDVSNLDTSSVRDMGSMFYGSQATELDLSSFDTSKVTDMGYMFEGSQATKLDLSSFDTSSVPTMYNMFYNSKATTLDLSSFDMSSVTRTSDMFSGAHATIGYAKTEQDADRLNATTNKPAGLLFVVYRDPTLQSNEVDVTVLPGEFSLTAPEISDGFGSVVLEADVQTLNASFGAPFTVKDLRGTQEGWRLDVQADPLANGEHTLPASSLTLKPVADIVRVGSGSGALPISSQTAVQPIDAGSAVELVSAPTGGGMGVFDITLPADALAFTIDATTARTDGGVYKTTLNWSLVQAP